MKKQNILKQIKFRSQYLYLVSELIDNAFFLNKDFSNVCLIANGLFMNKVIGLINKSFYSSKIDIIDINKFESLNAKSYDLILAPLSLQFLTSFKYDISKLHDSLKPGGVILASGFNVLSSTDSILEFKDYLIANKTRANLLNFFALGETLNKYSFKDKALDRENLLIEGNKVELINLFCAKKDQESAQNNIKIVID